MTRPPGFLTAVPGPTGTCDIVANHFRHCQHGNFLFKHAVLAVIALRLEVDGTPRRNALPTLCTALKSHAHHLRRVRAKRRPLVQAQIPAERYAGWPNNKWSRGSYSFPTPGEVTRVGPLLRSGVDGRIHFAGEHTFYAFTGYMEAALQSGLRVAEQLARKYGVIT
jgi:hypothetical protein